MSIAQVPFSELTTRCDCGGLITWKRQNAFGTHWFQCDACKNPYTDTGMLNQMRRNQANGIPEIPVEKPSLQNQQVAPKLSYNERLMVFCLWVQGEGFDRILQDMRGF